MKKGFSLIEMLIVLGIFSVIGVVMTQVLGTSLRSSRKSENIGVVKENIESALAIMERMLRDASSINCSASQGNQLVFYDNSVNSYGVPNPVEVDFVCQGIPNGDAHLVKIRGGITQRLTSEEVVIEDCQIFSCVESPSGTPPPYVDISIRARHRDSTGGEGASVNYNTRILLRTY